MKNEKNSKCPSVWMCYHRLHRSTLINSWIIFSFQKSNKKKKISNLKPNEKLSAKNSSLDYYSTYPMYCFGICK